MRVADCVEDGYHYNEPCTCPILPGERATMSLGCWVRVTIRTLVLFGVWTSTFPCRRCPDCHRCRYHGAACR